MSALPAPLLTAEQYLAIERAAELKSEFLDGVMYAMSGGILPHARVCARFTRALGNSLWDSGCELASADLRVRVAPQGPFFYPDVSVYCGAPELADDYHDALLNPIVIVEVLSVSTEGYDRGQKFTQYRRIGTLREYVLVSQTQPLVEVFTRREDGTWIMTEVSGLDAVCRLESVRAEISLNDVYRGVIVR